jgi:hypothetical protein
MCKNSMNTKHVIFTYESINLQNYVLNYSIMSNDIY